VKPEELLYVSYKGSRQPRRRHRPAELSVTLSTTFVVQNWSSKNRKKEKDVAECTEVQTHSLTWCKIGQWNQYHSPNGRVIRERESDMT